MRPRVVLSSKASPRIKAAYAQKIVEASRAPENFRRSQFIHSYPWISMNSLGWSWMQHPIDYHRFLLQILHLGHTPVRPSLPREAAKPRVTWQPWRTSRGSGLKWMTVVPPCTSPIWNLDESRTCSLCGKVWLESLLWKMTIPATALDPRLLLQAKYVVRVHYLLSVTLGSGTSSNRNHRSKLP